MPEISIVAAALRWAARRGRPSNAAGTDIMASRHGGDRALFKAGRIARAALSAASLGALLLTAGPAAAQCLTGSVQTTLVDGAGFTWDITRTGAIANGTNDAYDGGLHLYVGGTAFPIAAQTTELGGRQVVSGPVLLARLNVVRRVYVPADRGWARFVDSYTNPETSTITVQTVIQTDLGSNLDTIVADSSTGDALFSPPDRWVVTDDAPNTGDPAVAFVSWGTDAAIVPTIADRTACGATAPDRQRTEFLVTIPPGQTRYVMYFAAQRAARADAIDQARLLDPPPPEALVGLSPAVQALIVNWFLPLPCAPLAPSTGGPDAFGYTFADNNAPNGPAYAFEDIWLSGTPVPIGDDSFSAPIPLGFDFNFYGTNYSQLFISSNGFLSFNPVFNGCCTGLPIPAFDGIDGIIAGWWEDLCPPCSTTGGITRQILGMAPNRRAIIQFTNVARCCDGGNVSTFQFKLFERTNAIEVHYRTARSVGLGQTHSAGIEDPSGTIGLQYRLVTSQDLCAQTAVRYAPRPHADAGGPYTVECSGPGTSIALSGANSFDPGPGPQPLSYAWTTDCPNASFDNPASATPTLTFSAAPGCTTCNVTLTVSDGQLSHAASQSVTVVDTTPPTLTLSGEAVVTLECGTLFADPGAAASDACAGDLSNAVTTESDLNPGATGQYTITYRVSDPCGNAAVPVVRTVNVADTTPPTVVCRDISAAFTGSPLVLAPGDVFDSGSDGCGAVTPASVTPDTFGCADIGSAVTVTLTATDAAGNPATCTAQVTITDGRLPPGDVYVDDDYAGLAACDPVAFPYSGAPGPHSFGYNAFPALSAALAAVQPGGTIHVAPGAYPGGLVVDKAVAIRGSGAAQTRIVPTAADSHECSRFNADGQPGIDGDHHGLVVRSAGVLLADLRIDGDDDALGFGGPGARNFRHGVVIDAAGGVVDNLRCDGVEVRNVARAGFALAGGTGHELTRIRAEQCGVAPGCPGCGVMFENSDGLESTLDLRLDNAVIAGCDTALLTDATGPPGENNPRVALSRLTISDCRTGLRLAALGGGSVVGGSPAEANTLTGTGAGDDVGLLITRALDPETPDPGTVVVSHNTLTAFDRGIVLVNNAEADTPLRLIGNQLAAPTDPTASVAIWCSDDGAAFGVSDGPCYADLAANSIDGFGVGILLTRTSTQASGGFVVQSIIGGPTPADSNSVINAQTAVRLRDADGPADEHRCRAAVRNNALSFVYNAVGVEVDGAAALLEGNQLSGNSSAGVLVRNDALVDAGDATTGNLTGLGSSAGGNLLAGYDSFAGRLAIDDQNLDAGANLDVRAQQNFWGSLDPEPVVLHTFDDPARTQVFFEPVLPPPTLTLRAAGAGCRRPGDALVVEIAMDDALAPIVGGQFFLSYDATRLQLSAGGGGDPPFTYELFQDPPDPVVTNPGTLDLAIGVPLETPSGVTGAAVLARVTFTVLPGADDCALPGLVSFRPHAPPTRLTDEFGSQILTSTLDLPAITLDATPPAVSVAAIGGAAAVACAYELPFSGTVSDLCGPLEPANVQVTTAVLSGAATITNVSFTATPVSPGELSVSGTALVTLASCTAEIEVTIGAADCAGNEGIAAAVAIATNATPPLISGTAPAPVNAAAGGCTAAIALEFAAFDACTSATPLPLSYAADLVDPPGDFETPISSPFEFSAGVTPVRATATDACGNAAAVEFEVTVRPVNTLVVDLELGPTVAAGPLTRCITFELWNCDEPNTAPGAVIERDVTFIGGLATGVTFDAPCGAYGCLTARDRLHTLRRTADTLTIAAGRYRAAFTGPDRLPGGDLNDDGHIDLIDFGLFVTREGTLYGSGDTPCGTVGPHADINGDGFVGTIDFTFIATQFLQTAEANCCGAPGFAGGDGRLRAGPDAGRAAAAPAVMLTYAQLFERGLSDLIAADVNHDGVLDPLDLVTFAQQRRR